MVACDRLSGALFMPDHRGRNPVATPQTLSHNRPTGVTGPKALPSEKRLDGLLRM